MKYTTQKLNKRKAKDWWTPSLSSKARKEGWDLSTRDDRFLQVQRLDEADLIKSDLEAEALVIAKSSFSPLHKLACLLNRRHQDDEVFVSTDLSDSTDIKDSLNPGPEISGVLKNLLDQARTYDALVKENTLEEPERYREWSDAVESAEKVIGNPPAKTGIIAYKFIWDTDDGCGCKIFFSYKKALKAYYDAAKSRGYGGSMTEHYIDSWKAHQDSEERYWLERQNMFIEIKEDSAIANLLLWLEDNIGLDSSLHFDNEGKIRSQQVLEELENVFSVNPEE